MIDDGQARKWTAGGGFSVSVLVHAAALALLILGLPTLSLPEPPPVEAVQVELVPPEADAAEEQAMETPQEEPAAPPPEAQPEPPPEREAPAEPPPAGQDAMPVLDPVVRYGDADAGPTQAPDGDSAEQARQPLPEPAQPALPEPVESEVPALPEVLASQTVGGVSVHLAEPQDRPDEPAEKTMTADPSPLPLEEAKILFSPSVTNDPVATTAMRNLPRGVRVGKLCVTELREQLLRASPPYRPDILPQHEPSGTSVMVVPLTAFRADLQWYDLSFRCAVDADATTVVSFAFRVGQPIPREDWRRRGLPAR